MGDTELPSDTPVSPSTPLLTPPPLPPLHTLPPLQLSPPLPPLPPPSPSPLSLLPLWLPCLLRPPAASSVLRTRPVTPPTATRTSTTPPSRLGTPLEAWRDPTHSGTRPVSTPSPTSLMTSATG